MPVTPYVFHAVLFEDRGWWVAQCLERNLTASSKDPRELHKKLETVLKGQIEADMEAGKVPFSAIPPAPRRFWILFQSAEPWGLMIPRQSFQPENPALKRAKFE
jgi:hypothetical protein